MKWTKGFFAQDPQELEMKINDFFQQNDFGITDILYDVMDSGELGIYYTALIQYSTNKQINPVRVFIAESPEELEKQVNFYLVDSRAEIDVSNYATLFKQEKFVFSYIATFKQ
ncbi:hypothetical protein [Caldalkalibacillus mannanilyticus]|uniref:hypothetical protein n=1 Tax=Caldalkalibacillus mannanilyticus TaxID=1418 RepID=UPI000468458F|nr:hypothetical protein [Caldalkalibacillus mannanilyticus]